MLKEQIYYYKPPFVVDPSDAITIIVEDKNFLCYKKNLLRFEYFKAMLEGNFAEKRADEITLKDEDPAMFKAFMEFVDNDKTAITLQNAIELYIVADKYLVDSLKSQCITFIKQNINKRFKGDYSTARYALDLAIEYGQVTLVEELVRSGADLLRSFYYQKTEYKPLDFACYLNNINIAKILLPYIQKNANYAYNYYNHGILTPLIENNAAALLALLLDTGLFVDELKRSLKHNKSSFANALSLACSLNHLDCVKSIIKAHKNAKNYPYDGFGYQPLYYAIQQNNLELVKCLLDNFLGKNELNSSFYSQDKKEGPFCALSYACSSRSEYSEEIIYALTDAIKSQGIKIDDSHIHNALVLPLANENWLLVKAIIALADKNYHDRYEDHFINLIINNQLEGIKIFCENFPKFLNDCFTFAEKTGKQKPIFFAIMENKQNLAQWLFEQNPTITTDNYNNINAIHIAVIHRKPVLLEIFLKHAKAKNLLAQFFVKNGGGKLPIHHAMEQADTETTKLLIDYGALDDFTYSKTFFDNNSKTPLDLAADQGHQQFLFDAINHLATKCYKSNPTLINNLLYWAMIREYYQIFSELVTKYGANVNAHFNNSDSYLHVAVRKNRIGATKFLCEHKANVNHQNDAGRTPLHEAAENADCSIVQYLIGQKANIGLWDKKGKTALQLAANRRQHTGGSFFGSKDNSAVINNKQAIIYDLEETTCKVQ